MAFNRAWCDARRGKRGCLMHRELNNPLPRLPRGVISTARHAGLAGTAQELAKLRRMLNRYKKSPCDVCSYLGDRNMEPMQNLINAVKQASCKAGFEQKNIHAAATSSSSGASGIHGFVLAEPGKEPVAMDFTFTNVRKFLAVRFKGLFGGEPLAVPCRSVIARIHPSRVEIERVLRDVEIDVAAVPAQTD